MVRLPNYNAGEENGTGDYDDVRDDKNPSELPHYMTGFSRGRPSHFYVNGDVHFCGKKIVFNPRHFRDIDHYMDFLTDKIKPPFGAVRQVCTPHHGSRINALTDLQPGASYVVIGNGRFRKYPYDQITPSERKKSPARNYDADPVVHSRIYRSSGRVKKTMCNSKIIKVSANGKGQQGPRIVLLSWRLPWNLPAIISQVDDMLRKDCEGSVEKLYTTNGYHVMDVDQITHMGHYVALKKSDHFKRGPYLDRAVKSIQVSPRLSDGRFHLEPLFPRSNNSTSNSSPEHSNSNVSTQNGSVQGYQRQRARRRDREREENQVFPAKPVKHTRSSEKRQPLDLDKDEGGKFKAKQRNYNTAGAREVQDSRHTRTDVPIDQQEARQVDDEKIKRKERNKTPEEDINRSRPEPQQHQQPPQRNEYPRGGVQSKPNSKRPPQHAAPRNNNESKGTENLKYKDEERRRHKAATKIQAGYRGYKVRKQYPMRPRDTTPPQRYSPPKSPQRKDSPPTRGRKQRNATPQKRQSPPAREQGWTPQSLENDKTNDFDETDKAATKIQANFRGYRARKRMQAEKQKEEAEQDIEDAAKSHFDEENKAATRIQANYRGYRARSKLQAKQIEQDVKNKAQTPEVPKARDRNDDDDDEDDDIDEDFEQASAAAVKIQSSYRGHRVRRNLKANNFSL